MTSAALSPEMPLHVLHVVDNLGKGGLENGLANLITRLDARRFRHTVCAIRRLGANADRLSQHGVKVFCLEKESASFPVQLVRFMRIIRELRPHVLHSRNWPAIESVFAAQLLRACAIVHSEHGLDWSSRLREPVRRTCIRRLAFESADQVLCVSEELKVLHASRTRFNSNRIAVIHNGVDTVRFAPDPQARERIRTEHGISPDDFCIGCVGNLTPVKDHMTLLKAVDAFASSTRNWRLLIIGDGPERSRLEEFARSGHWSSRISFLGLCGQVSALLNAFDLYVLPSLSEGICNSLLEAMATQLPVLATAAGGNPEVVVDGESGRLFLPGGANQLAEELLLFYNRRDLRSQLGRAALKRVCGEFSIDAMVQKYDQLYTDLAMPSERAKHALDVPRTGPPFQTEELRSK